MADRAARTELDFPALKIRYSIVDGVEVGVCSMGRLESEQRADAFWR
jgi:hypothetical protein